ncbi:hypothetical protein [Ensifer soli]|uniref:hypothetical protein n=1 Tax=Ciceribacter sp. sgz301302 TaxID=3342379 RepID=UPI0035B8CA0F
MAAPSLTFSYSGRSSFVDVAQPRDFIDPTPPPPPTKGFYVEEVSFDVFAVFIEDLATGERTLIEGAYHFQPLFFSADESILVLQSGNASYPGSVYFYHLDTAELKVVSTYPNGTKAQGHSPSLSENGEVLAFVSLDPLLPDDTNGGSDVYVKNLTDGTLRRVSSTFDGGVPNEAVRNAKISPDGTKVLFTTQATNMTGYPDGRNQDVFVRDLVTGELVHVSRAANGGASNGTNSNAYFSPDGSWILFNSTATNLVATPGSGSNPTYKYDLRPEGRLIFDATTSGSTIRFETGDGSAAIVENGAGGAPVQISHLYQADGNYTARLVASQAGEPDSVRNVNVVIRGYGDAAVSLVGTGGIDMMLLSRFNDLATGGNGDDILKGAGGDDTLSGGNGNDWLDGGTGDDTLNGGAGDDRYFVDSLQDRVVEGANAGIDTVSSTVDYTLGDHVENLTLLGFAALSGTGNMLANTIIGNRGANTLNGLAGDDWLEGGGGKDTLVGGLGDDTYVVVTNDNDVIVEAANAGTDTVRVSTTGVHTFYTLGRNLENLVLLDGMTGGTGNDADNTIIGNRSDNQLRGGAGADRLEGGAGNDYLDGGAGNDLMIGGSGDDTYVWTPGDIINERANGGIDTVETSFDVSIPLLIENVRLTGATHATATGNDGDNVLTGNDGNNTLRGLGGNDTLIGGPGSNRLEGGSGNDLYIVSGTRDTIVEEAGGGIDTVHSSANHFLAAHVENLVLLGTANLAGSGNDLANVITGNSGNNKLLGGAGDDTLIGGDGDDILQGGLGIDRMIGGQGNDTYGYSAGDIIVEEADGGIDTVVTSVAVTLASMVENAELLGSAHVGATGNAIANVLTGNTGNNHLRGLGGADTLLGGRGDDTLEGGAGTDLLTGGIGKDTFLYRNASEGGDLIVDFVGAWDKLAFSSDGFDLGLSPRQLGAHMFVAGSGATATRNYAQFLYDTDTQTLSLDKDGRGSGAAVLIATFADNVQLQASDIFLI